MSEMRALTVRQPWAHLIAHCGKHVENRPWPVPRTFAPGTLLAIHAGSGWDDSAGHDPAALAAWQDWAASLPPPNITGPLRRDAIHIDSGAIIAVASMAGWHDWRDCTDHAALGARLCSPWARAGQWHWELAGVRPLPVPVPCRGKLGLWRLPPDAEKAVREQAERDSDG